MKKIITEVAVLEGADGFNGLNVYSLDDDGDIDYIIDQYEYPTDDPCSVEFKTDLDILEEIKKDYTVIQANGLGYK